MGKYTVELNEYLKFLAGAETPPRVLNIIEASRQKIFDEDYPIFDESYRQTLETKILRHYYFREIGFETVARFKEYLNRTMWEIMPYYNKLYLSELLHFNPLYDTDMYTSSKRKTDGNSTDTSTTNRDSTRAENEVGTDNRIGTGTSTDTSTGTSTSTDTSTDTSTSTDASTSTSASDKTGSDTRGEKWTEHESNEHNENGTTGSRDSGNDTDTQTLNLSTSYDESVQTDTDGRVTTDTDSTTTDNADGTKTITQTGQSTDTATITTCFEENSTLDKTNHNTNKYSDTPQGALNLVSSGAYLTNYTEIDDTGRDTNNHASEQTQSDSRKGTTGNNQTDETHNDATSSTNGTSTTSDDTRVTTDKDSLEKRTGTDTTRHEFGKITDGEHQTSGSGEKDGTRNGDIKGSNTEHTEGEATENRTGEVNANGTRESEGETRSTNDRNEEKKELGNHEIDRTGTENMQTQAHQDHTMRSLEDYIHHVEGKSAGASYSKLLLEFRETFLNIDKMILDDLEQLFFGLW